MRYKILIIDDQEKWRKEIIKVFNTQNDFEYELFEASSKEEALQALKNSRFDVITIDMRFEIKEDKDSEGGLKILHFLETLRHWNPSSVAVVFTAYPSFRNCVEAMRYGAWDYIDKNNTFIEYKDDNGRSIPSVQMLLRSVKEGLEHRFSSEAGPNSLWLQEHLPELVEKYSGKMVAFIGEEVIGAGDSKEELQNTINELDRKKAYYMWIPKSREVL